MNNIDKTINVVKTKKHSGWLWILISFVLLLLIIPFLIYGIVRASYNGIVWTSKHNERKLSKLERKEIKLNIKDKIYQHKQIKKERKERNENSN